MPRRAGACVAGLGALCACLAASLPTAQASGPPQIDATWATAVTATSADLHAEADPEGIATTYRFEYITEALYRENLNLGHEAFAGAARLPSGAEAPLGSGSAGAEAAQHVGNLKAATAYRYRIVAHSAAGTTPGTAFAFATQEPGTAFALPDQRAWELVSPPQKNGGSVQGFGADRGGGVFQAAANGEAVTYSSAASFSAAASGAPPASQYLSRRGGAGWSTGDITAPAVSGSYGEHPDGVPYQLFSPDLARGLMLSGERCRGAGSDCPVANPPLPDTEAPAGYQDYYLRDDEAGGFEALLTGADLGGLLSLPPEDFELSFAGASPDLRHVVLSTCAALTPEATEVPSGGGGCEPAEANLYEWGEGGLQLLNVLPGQTHGTPGARLAAQSAAISANGSRVYFTELEDGALYLREAGGPTKLLPESVAGGASFQTASADGSLAFFTRAGTLYRYVAQAETSEPLATGVQGVLGASENGSYLYYETAAGLFLWREGAGSTKIAAKGAASDWPPSTGTARVSPDGAHLAFLSAASLTGYDNTDQSTGQPDDEVYLYQAPAGGGGGTLTCASCNPTGERPLGPSTIPGAVANGEGPEATDSYEPRDLSEAGSRLFFDSSDALVPHDTNVEPDVYEWEAAGAGTCQHPAGCISLISDGQSGEPSEFIDASATGRDAFFLTADSLVGSDPGSYDLYDAREGGGFPAPSPPIACEGDSCQSLPSPPEDPTPGTLLPGPGNPPVHFPEAHSPKKPHKKKHHKKKLHPKRGRR